MTQDPSLQMSRTNLIRSALVFLGIVGIILAVIGNGLVLLYGFEVVSNGDAVHGSIDTGGVVAIAGFLLILIVQFGWVKHAN